MNESIYLRIWGELACFTRPEMKVERVSYSVMTPSAARGLLEAILYKPQFRWRVHRIAVKKPIRFLALKRNEVKDTISETQLKAAANGDAVEVIFADEMSKNKGRTQVSFFSARPALNEFVHHIDSNSPDIADLCGALCNRIKELNQESGAQGFPPLLDLEAQGRFALGYYSYFARVKATPDEAKIEEESEKLPADNE